jgi:exonuclease SbcC
MRPTQLQLKNFLSYHGEHSIPFQDVSLAAISGKNGHGKSALLDAITWALFGEARKASGTRKPDDEILNRTEAEGEGDAQMGVILTFDQGDATYEVARYYRETASGKTTQSGLHLKNRSAETDLTAGNQRNTQAEIEDVLGMDYDLFTSTSMMEQGQWDQLMTATPAERKDLLFDLLQLGRFEEIETRAKDRRQTLGKSIEDLERKIDYNENQLEGHSGRVDEMQALKEQSAKVEGHIQSLQEKLSEAREKAEMATRLRHEIGTASERAEELEAKIEETQAEIDEAADRLSGLEEEQAGLDLPDEDSAGVEKQLEELKTRQAQAEARKTQIEDLKGEIAGLREDHRPPEHFQSRLTELEEEGQSITSDYEENPTATIEKLQSQIGTMEANLSTKRERIGKLESRLENLSAGDPCPTCEQPLTEEHLAGLGAEELKETRASKVSLEQNLEVARAALSEAKEDRSALEELREQYKTLEEKADQAVRRRQQLDTKRAKLSELEGKQPDLSAIRGRIAELTETAQRFERAEKISEEIGELQSALEQAHEEKNKLQKKKAEREERLSEKKERLEALGSPQGTVEETEEKLERERRQDREISSKIGRLESKLEDDEEALQAVEEAEEDLEEAREDYQTYDDLASAFGRDGLPSMILETAIPSIEERTNALLSDLTGGEYQVRLETTRETQDGGQTGTMDITILARGSERPYEGLSGGERFRTAFALRVALSQHLAARSGRPIETLIVDEGFGTQDTEGQRKVQSALATASESFDLVLAITHVQALRDAFPQRLAVEKTATGSHVTVHT